MCIAYNLTRLVYLELEHGIEVDFAAGVAALQGQPWKALEHLHAAQRGGA